MDKKLELIKALGDENRMRILLYLQEGEKCACSFLQALSISQSTLSHHLKVLQQAGLVTSRKEGKWVYYALKEGAYERGIEAVAYLLMRKDPYQESLPCL